MSSPIEPLSLPPTGIYASFDALLEAAQAHAAAAGYAFTTQRSTKKNGRIIKTLSCKKGGHEFRAKVNDENRKRQRTTFKTDCPFRITAKERPTGQWELQCFSAGFTGGGVVSVSLLT
ncbi:hypothetical protein DL95DRAFT_471943 [Leptodontidium sp. 2 PMI_412]|nr:hypothetical protein DL95DRAFT_471943 [Leptodontidium sp. 2 PMI_412]